MTAATAERWPTFRRLVKGGGGRGGLLDHYLWQWGVLWDMKSAPANCQSAARGSPPDAKVKDFLPRLMAEAKAMRAGILTEMTGDFRSF